MSASDALQSEVLSVSAVMPVFNGMGFIEQSLPPLLALVGRGLLEVLVVDDGSTDGSREWAESRDARVMSTGGPLGPAEARNRGAAEARGDVLLFVDADVVVHADAVDAAVHALADPLVVAVFGSYDAAPPDRAFASQYMNLRHYYTHQRGAGEASTFWAGCGAVRRRAFLDVGGYDASRYRRPSIEDIELGYRLRQAGGRILNRPDMQGTHLKRWTLGSVIRTDLLCRAIPWSRLMLAHPSAVPDLNTGRAEQAKALLAGAFAASVLAAAVGALAFWLPAVVFVAALAANAPLFRVFRKRGGWLFGLGAMLFHQLYYLYSAAGYLYCVTEHRLGGGGDRASAGSGEAT